MTNLYTIPNLTSGIDQAIVGTVTAVPSFIPMLLLFVFSVVWISGVTAQRKRSGYSDIPLWTTISSLSMMIVALPLTLTAGLINLDWLVIVVVITIFSGIWLFLDKNRMEV